MHFPKKYFHDRAALLFISINAFLALLCMVMVLLRLDGARSSGYIAEYRVNLGVSPFKPGTLSDILAFIVFGFLVAGLHMFLSARIYTRHRQYAIAILAMGTLLLVLNIIVSNALLVLR